LHLSFIFTPAWRGPRVLVLVGVSPREPGADAVQVSARQSGAWTTAPTRCELLGQASAVPDRDGAVHSRASPVPDRDGVVNNVPWPAAEWCQVLAVVNLVNTINILNVSNGPWRLKDTKPVLPLRGTTSRVLLDMGLVSPCDPTWWSRQRHRASTGASIGGTNRARLCGWTVVMLKPFAVFMV
jgi:hypothetical protein